MFTTVTTYFAKIDTVHLTASNCILTNLLFNCISVISHLMLLIPHHPSSLSSKVLLLNPQSSSLTIPHPSVLSSGFQVGQFVLLLETALQLKIFYKWRPGVVVFGFFLSPASLSVPSLVTSSSSLLFFQVRI